MTYGYLTEKSIRSIAHRLKDILGRDMEASELVELMRKAVDHLTPAERELVAAKIELGLCDSEIMKRFGFGSRGTLESAFKAVFALLREYCIYFATASHARAAITAKLDLGGDVEHWQRVFEGKRQVSNPLRYPYESVEDSDVKAFIKTTIEISKYRRL